MFPSLAAQESISRKRENMFFLKKKLKTMLLSRRKLFFGNMFPSLVTKQTSRRNSVSTAMSHSLARPSDYHKMMSKNVQNGSSGTTSRMGDTVCLFVCLFVCLLFLLPSFQHFMASFLR